MSSCHDKANGAKVTEGRGARVHPTSMISLSRLAAAVVVAVNVDAEKESSR